MTKDIWITSDTHFGHENIIKYCDRPFPDAPTMDFKILDNWNSAVKPGDKVYHLGDVYMGSKESAFYILSRLHGKKRLVVGNHDDLKSNVLHKFFQKISLWRDLRDFGVLLTHVPLHQKSILGDHSEERKNKRVNVHGHIHNQESPDGPYFNACVEHHNYTPINLEELRDRLKKIE